MSVKAESLIPLQSLLILIEDLPKLEQAVAISPSVHIDPLSIKQTGEIYSKERIIHPKRKRPFIVKRKVPGEAVFVEIYRSDGRKDLRILWENYDRLAKRPKRRALNVVK